MKISMKLPISFESIQSKQIKGLSQMKDISNDLKLREAANDFEAIFVKQMLETMRKTSIETNLIPKSEGEKVFQSMLDEHYSKIMATSGSLGLGEMIYQQLIYDKVKK